MKKGKVLTAIVVGLLGFSATTLLAAITLPGFVYPNYIGPVRITSADSSGPSDQTFWVSSTIYAPSQSNISNPTPATADALVTVNVPVKPRNNGTNAEDSWGIGVITEIAVSGPNNLNLPSGTPLWLPSATNELTFSFYGLLDEKVQIDSTGTGHIASRGLPAGGIYPGGAFFDFWYHTPSFAGAVTNGPSGRGDGAGSQPANVLTLQYPGVTVGTHWLSMQMQTGADSFATPTSVLRSDVTGTSPFPIGDSAYADVSSSGVFGAGSDNASFVNHGQSTDLPGIYRDASIQVPLLASGSGGGTNPVPYGWTAHNLNTTATLLTLINCTTNLPTVSIVPLSATVVTFVFQAPVNGMSSIGVLLSNNAIITGTNITAGTTGAVTVTATKINPSLKAVIDLQATDLCGNINIVDPVATALTVKHNKMVTQTFDSIPPEEHFVSLKNAVNGLARVTVRVNRKTYFVNNLRAGEVRVLDVGAAMYYADNTVTLTGFGTTGASATVLIGDSAASSSKAAVVRAHTAKIAGWGNLTVEEQR